MKQSKGPATFTDKQYSSNKVASLFSKLYFGYVHLKVGLKFYFIKFLIITTRENELLKMLAGFSFPIDQERLQQVMGAGKGISQQLGWHNVATMALINSGSRQ